MLNLAIYDTGCIETVGVPEIFLRDEDIRYLLSSVNARKDLIELYGVGVSVGRLGKETAAGFIEEENIIEINTEMTEKRGDLGAYAML